MDKFDEKVIGYESTKDILRQILDILKRPEVYKRKGISIPRGLLMESDPGLGKRTRCGHGRPSESDGAQPHLSGDLPAAEQGR